MAKSQNNIIRLKHAARQLELIEEQQRKRERYIAGQLRRARYRRLLPRIAIFLAGFIAAQVFHLWLL